MSAQTRFHPRAHTCGGRRVASGGPGAKLVLGQRATHGSDTGAFPGLRQGMYLVLSLELPAGMLRPLVRYLGSFSVGCLVVLHTFRPPGTRSPLPSHSEHPIVHPWLNQKQLCPDSHGSVPLLQSQPKGMYFQWPVMGNWRWCLTLSELLFHGSSCESIAFREGG